MIYECDDCRFSPSCSKTIKECKTLHKYEKVVKCDTVKQSERFQKVYCEFCEYSPECGRSTFECNIKRGK